MEKKPALMVTSTIAACLYFAFNLEFVTLVITTSMLLFFISRDEAEIVKKDVEKLRHELMEMRISMEVSEMELLPEPANQDYIDDQLLANYQSK